MALGLAVCATLVHWTLAASATNADAVDEESLLCTVSEAAGLVWARRAWSAVETCQLTVLPAADAQNVSQHIALFLAIQLLNVTVCTHCYSEDRPSNEIRIRFFDQKSHHRSIPDGSQRININVFSIKSSIFGETREYSRKHLIGSEMLTYLKGVSV